MVKYYSYILLLCLITTACKKTEVVPKKPIDLVSSVHLTMGNPSNAITDVNNANNYLMEKIQYVISYNKDRGIPNWISWHVSKDWLGSAPRQDDFRADNTLPSGWYRVPSTAYSSSGFDRGHNTPSADRTKSEADNSATFLMTNMIPQAPNHNRETWENLESYTRILVNQGNEVYVIMGNYGSGGIGSNGSASSIDNGRVTVPAQIWKVIIVLPEGIDDVNRVTTSTRIIAVNTPNINTISSAWGTYRTSVDAIETATGYDLLNTLPDNIEVAIESKIDAGATQ